MTRTMLKWTPACNVAAAVRWKIEKLLMVRCVDDDYAGVVRWLGCQKGEGLGGDGAETTVARAYYAKVMEDMSFKLHEQQDWFKSHKPIKEVEERTLGHTAKNCSKMHLANMDIHLTGCYTSEKYKDLETQLESAKAKHEEITAKKSKLALENSKIKQNIEQLRSRFDDFPAELKAMDINALEEEQKALLSDKAGEMEYLQSLQERTEQIKAISEVVKCHCGQEYAVEMSQ